MLEAVWECHGAEGCDCRFAQGCWLGRLGAIDTWPTEIWLVFGSDGHFGWGWAATVQSLDLLNVLLHEGIVTEICAEPRKIIGVG
jgi:hypothetical protein